MADQLADKLKSTQLSDGSPGASDEWKKNLNLPAKDNRQQTEVHTTITFSGAFPCADLDL
jgi:ATP-dependent RNA helicase DDX6/DHH1